MINLKSYPALKHAGIFACGILLARLLNPSINFLLVLIGLSLLLLFLSGAFLRFLFLPTLLLTVGVSGGLLYQIHDRHSGFLRGAEIEDAEVIGRLLSDPLIKPGYVEWRLAPDSVLWRNSSAVPEGDLIFRLHDSVASAGSLPAPGSRVSVRGLFRIPSSPRIPGEFDYGEWLRSRGVAGTFDCYRRSDMYVFGVPELPAITSLRLEVKRYVQGFARRWIGGEEGDIAVALIIGDRSGIDPQTRDAFAVTGTAHLLAVSGLHVGIIALLLFVAVSWIPGRWIRFLLFALSLAGYTIVVGGSPSILRASTMAVLFLLAYTIGRITQPLNILGGAALLILLFDPAALFDLGFQLSFAAVAGILLFHLPLWNYLKGRFPRTTGHPVAGRLAQLFLLSIGAQILTIPLILHYFGSLSPISPFVNVLAVPLITAGLGAGVAGVLLPFAAKWFGGAAWLAIAGGRELIEWGAGFAAASVQFHRIGVVTLLLMSLALLWLILARGPVRIPVRAASFILLLAILAHVDRRLDPLARSSSGYLYLVPLSRSGGIAAAVHHDDTVTLWYGGLYDRDSTSAARIASLLRERLRASSLEVIDLLRDTTSVSRSGLLRINRVGPEYASPVAPVILTNSARRSPGPVEIDGERFARIPMQRRLERTIVLDPGRNWRPIVWD